MSPSTTVVIDDADNAKNLLRLLDALENQDDVQNVYANFDMDQKYFDQFMP
jgi:transcriptional/translational regulatory protein YebC/TACO1